MLKCMHALSSSRMSSRAPPPGLSEPCAFTRLVRLALCPGRRILTDALERIQNDIELDAPRRKAHHGASVTQPSPPAKGSSSPYSSSRERKRQEKAQRAKEKRREEVRARRKAKQESTQGEQQPRRDEL